MREVLEFVVKKEREHTHWRAQCLNMIASENVLSPSVRRRLCSDFGHRYVNIYGPTLSTKWQAYEKMRWYEGLDHIEEVERRCFELLQKLFDASYADYRPLSGNIAILDTWLSLTKYGETILTRGPTHGGHGKGWDDLAILLGRKIEHYPFDPDEFSIDVDKAKVKIRKVKPRLLVFGASQILFQEPVEELSEVADEVGAHLVYDGSHVMGLIAGKQFQDPLRENVVVLFGSSHKTFPGPQGGFILSNAEGNIPRLLDENLCHKIIDSYHQNRVAALTIAAGEILEFGEAYSSQVLKNAQTLAQALHEEGFNVLCEHKGFTRSHQILIDVSKRGTNGAEAAKTLIKANIVTNQVRLPVDEKRNINSGLRIGTPELTRVGMKESEMKHIAELYRKVLIEKNRYESIRREVVEFTESFQKIHYSFDEGKDAYAFWE